MKPSLRKWLSTLFIVATLAAVVLIAFQNNDLENTLKIFSTLDLKWMLGALGCWLAYIFFDALSYHLFLKTQGHPISFWYAIYITIIGFYYGNITPGASGGQPMQVYYMTKKDVPVGVGTSAISIRFACNESAIVLTGMALWLFNWHFVEKQLAGVRFLAVFGMLFNFAAVLLVLMTVVRRSLVQRILNWGVKVGTKMRLIRKPEVTLSHLNTTLDTYHASAVRLGRKPGQIFAQLLFAILSNLGLMGIVVFTYYAFGESGTPWYQLLTISYLLYVTASFTPLPGASGAQEGGFLLYYKGLFSAGTIGPALLIWRFVNYYLMIIVGAVLTLIYSIFGKKKKRAKVKDTKGDKGAKDAESIGNAQNAADVQNSTDVKDAVNT